MKRTSAFIATIAFFAASSSYADWSVGDKGTWPESWPEELEPLREQSRSLEGSLLNLIRYEIPFTKRDEFESAWLHLLKVKSKGAPIVLVRGPHKPMGKLINAGVIVHCPPSSQAGRPEVPLTGDHNDKRRWIFTTFIELVVDGDVVDLNRIPLPPDTPIIDERFKDEQNKSPKEKSG